MHRTALLHARVRTEYELLLRSTKNTIRPTMSANHFLQSLSMRTHAPAVFDDGAEVCLRHRLIEDLGTLGGKKFVSQPRNDCENAITYLQSRPTSPMDRPEALEPSERSKAYLASPESMENPPMTPVRLQRDGSRSPEIVARGLVQLLQPKVLPQD